LPERFSTSRLSWETACFLSLLLLDSLYFYLSEELMSDFEQIRVVETKFGCNILRYKALGTS
jgi:hypothetical protein